MATPIDTPLLEVRGVSKVFDGVVHALDDVSITVHQNEIVGVVGENGAGKSTLMKILVGVKRVIDPNVKPRRERNKPSRSGNVCSKSKPARPNRPNRPRCLKMIRANGPKSVSRNLKRL